MHPVVNGGEENVRRSQQQQWRNPLASRTLSAEEQQGSAAGFLATGRVVGQSVSVALSGAIFTSLGGATAGHELITNKNLTPAQIANLQQTFTHAFHTTFIVCACIAAVGIFTSLVRGKES